MTKKLEDLFDLPSSTADIDTAVPDIATTQYAITEIDNAIDKIDAALPGVRDLEASDGDMDELAQKATETFDDLMDLGMQVDSRYASEIFAVAGAMLGHALTAKTAKMNKKLKMIQLQLQKAKLDLDREKAAGASENDDAVETAEGQVLSRNDLLDRLIGTREQKNKPA
jgi:DNA-directed RNA polymerase beta' subunit